MDAIILAAGYSSRTNTYKMALVINRKPILSHIIETFYPFCENLIVVGGHYFDATKALTKPYSKVKLIKNERYDLGMFSSIKVGVSETNGDFFITPGDYPLVSKFTCEQMTHQFLKSKENGYDILIPTYIGKRGHPILLTKNLKEPLLMEGDNSNLRIFQKRHKMDFLEVKDEGILLDIDTMEDYHNLNKINEKRCAYED